MLDVWIAGCSFVMVVACWGGLDCAVGVVCWWVGVGCLRCLGLLVVDLLFVVYGWDSCLTFCCYCLNGGLSGGLF